MATFNRTLNITSTSSGSPTSITQNVAPGDQINVTVNGPNGDDIFADADTNCSSSQGGAYSSGTVVALTSFSGSSYTYTMTTTNGSKNNPVFHYGRVTGSISSATDNTPENYTNLAGNKTGAALSTNYYATFSTTAPGTTSPGTGFNVGTTVDNGTAVSVASGQYRIDTGSFTSTAGTVNQNQTVYYRRTSSASYYTAVSGSLTIGDTTRTFNITTFIAPPDSLSFGTPNNGSATANVQVNAAGGSGGTLKVSEDNSTWYANGTSFAKTRGTTYTFYARREGTGVNSSSYSDTYLVPYEGVDDTTPESYGNLAGNVTNAASNTYFYATFNTNAAGSVANGTGFSLSGEIDVSITASATGGQVRTSADATWAASKTVTASDTVFYRGLSATTGAGSSVKTHTLTMGTVTQSFQTSLSVVGSNNYGFQVYNPSEELIVDSRTFKQVTVIVSGSTGVGGQTSSSFISCPDMTSTNQSEVEIIYLEYPDPVGFGSAAISTTRGTGTNEGKFQINCGGSTGTTYTIKWLAVRY